VSEAIDSEPRARYRRSAARAGGVALIASLMFTTSAGVAVSPVAAAVDALAVLAARSPGVRDAGVFSAKLARDKLAFALGGDAPVLAPPVDSEFAPIPAAAALPADNPLGALAGPVGGIEGFGAGPDGYTTSDSYTPIGGGGGLGGGSGGPAGFAPGGGGGGGVAPPVPTPTPTPGVSVPEPGHWAMMIAALFVLGGFARRRLRSEATTG
jgi:hypothetical protein